MSIKAKSILPNFSSFVSASAGTGKTKTLIDRLLNLLLHNVKPHKILCLAFTKAAAAEILHRLNQKLAELCMSNREDLHKELNLLGFQNITPELENKARILFMEFIDATETLNVQTIHSFCQKLLSKFPLESGININFTLLEGNQMINMIILAKNTLLESIDQHPNLKAALQYLSWHIKEYSLDLLLNEIIENREKLDHFFKKKHNLNLEMDNDENDFILQFISLIPKDKLMLDILLNSESKTEITRAQNLQKFFAYSESLQAMMIHEYLNCFLTKIGEPLKRLITKKLQEEHPELSNLLYTEQSRAHEFLKLYSKIKLKNLTQSFIILSYYVRMFYQKLKQQNNSLDYDDLISLSSDLLSNSEYADWIRYKLDGGIDHILVDEAQDNSENQWNIINKISEEFFYSSDVMKSLFIVGDAKQSIFRFQGADPQIFNAMNQSLPKDTLRLQLNTSFRSGSKILEFIDHIFNQAHIRPLVTNVEKNIQHIAHKNFEGEIEIWPLIIEPEAIEEKSWSLPQDYKTDSNPNADEILSLKIAEQILNWLKEKKFLHSKNRPINPGDILILSRRRNEFVKTLIKTLKQMNIPVSGLDRINLLKAPAVLDLIALSEFLLNKNDDMNLAIILKSPLFNLNEEQLTLLCHNREKTLWEALKNSEQYENICNFLEGLAPNSIFQFYFELLETKNLRTIFTQHFGLEVNDVLDSFLDVVEQFENENISSLQLFIDFLRNANINIQRSFLQQNNQVRVMTIHGAKGLQAPIVILADTTSLPHNDDSIIWLNDEELLWPGKAKYYSEDVREAKADVFVQEYAEYLRLLYVAVTRAEEQIIITGTSDSEKISEKSWYSIISNSI